MGNPAIDQLRRALEAKHTEAMRLLQRLQLLLEEPLIQVNGEPIAAKKRPPRAGTGKIRNAVLPVFSRDYLSVEAVAKETGFTVAQVRGVVSAPRLKKNFLKKEIAGMMCYKFQEEEAE